jgi:hypothetical protein
MIKFFPIAALVAACPANPAPCGAIPGQISRIAPGSKFTAKPLSVEQPALDHPCREGIEPSGFVQCSMISGGTGRGTAKKNPRIQDAGADLLSKAPG